MQSQQFLEYLILNPWLLFILIIWTLAWKGTALWMAAKRDQKNWFIALLVLNTIGLLEITYILITRNKEKRPDKPKEDETQN